MKSLKNKIEFRHWIITDVNKNDAEVYFEIKTSSEFYAKNQCEQMLKQEGYVLDSVKCQKTKKEIATLIPRTHILHICHAKAHRKKQKR